MSNNTMAEEASPISLKYYSEKGKRTKAFYEKLWKDILTPPEWMQGLESIFTWGLHIQLWELVRWNIPDKLSDYVNQGAFYGFESLAFLLAMIFYKTLYHEEQKILKIYSEESKKEKHGSESKSNEDSEEDSESEDESETEDPYEPEKSYDKCVEILDEMAATEGDIMYGRIGPALQHVLQATRAHMLLFNGNLAESKELVSNIQPIEEMDQKCRAGLEGLKAKFVMSRVQNYQIVLPYLHKAMELDPEFGYWPYLTGKVLRRARREFDEDKLEEEFKYFKKAVSLERNPKFLVFLGQAYQEVALFLIQSRGAFDSADSLLKKSVELYRECWRLKSDSAPIARRVGNGLNKMRSQHTDKTLAKEALLTAIDLSPNNCTNLSLGKFYYIHEQNDEKALEQFYKAHPGNFGTSEIIRINLIKDPNYDPYDILKVWLEYEDKAVKQYVSFCAAVWYFLAFKRDVESAAKYIWKIIEKDNKFIRAKRALEFKSYAFCVENPINLIELIVNEILLMREQNKSSPLEDKKEMELSESCLQKIVEKYPDCNMNPRQNLLDDLKREVDQGIAIKRRRRYGNNNRRSETNPGSEELVNWRNDNHDEGSQKNNNQSHLRQQEGDGSRRFQWHGYKNNENGRRNNDMRSSFSVGDEDRRNRTYSGDDFRRNSESQSTSTARTSETRDPTDANSRYNRNYTRGRNDRQYSSHNNNRYDVTVTDWRSENRRQ